MPLIFPTYGDFDWNYWLPQFRAQVWTSPLPAASLPDIAVQRAVIDQVGDTPDDRLVKLMPIIWAIRAGYAQIDSYLQALYVKQDCIDIALAYVRDMVDTSKDGGNGNIDMSLDQRSKHLQNMRENVMADIKSRLEQVLGSVRAVVGCLHATQPIPKPFCDPEDMLGRILRGDAYIPGATNAGGWFQNQG